MKIIQISADWCPPCKAWKSRLEKIEGLNWEYVDLGDKKDIDAYRARGEEVREKYNLKFSSIPTFLIEHEGKSRVISQIELTEFIKEKRWLKD